MCRTVDVKDPLQEAQGPMGGIGAWVFDMVPTVKQKDGVQGEGCGFNWGSLLLSSTQTAYLKVSYMLELGWDR